MGMPAGTPCGRETHRTGGISFPMFLTHGGELELVQKDSRKD
jgi:hypothetical protein